LKTRIYLGLPPTLFHRALTAGSLDLLCPPSGSLSNSAGTGILTCHPSATPFGLVLGTDSPWAELPCPGNLRLTARRILIFFIATHPGRITWTSSRSRFRLPSSVRPTLPYQCARSPGTVRGFGSALSPVNFRRRVARLVSCYALFK
jgi:hypothetical protein